MSLSGVKMDELTAALKKKDEDMKAMEERYKMYLEKARDVITLNSTLKKHCLFCYLMTYSHACVTVLQAFCSPQYVLMLLNYV